MKFSSFFTLSAALCFLLLLFFLLCYIVMLFSYAASSSSYKAIFKYPEHTEHKHTNVKIYRREENYNKFINITTHTRALTQRTVNKNK